MEAVAWQSMSFSLSCLRWYWSLNLETANLSCLVSMFEGSFSLHSYSTQDCRWAPSCLAFTCALRIKFGFSPLSSKHFNERVIFSPTEFSHFERICLCQVFHHSGGQQHVKWISREFLNLISVPTKSQGNWQCTLNLPELRRRELTADFTASEFREVLPNSR